MTLKDAIRQSTIAEIGALLDGMTAGERLEATRSLGRSDQMALWEKAAEAAPLTLDDFVASDAGELVEVIHEGRNTLPVFTLFQKRFCRPSDGSARLFGYNEGATRGLIGPGYFVAYETADKPEWADRGAVVVDYFEVPDGEVVSTWPEVKRNEQGLQVLVYSKTRDFMRRVSSHVTIGRAWKKEKAMGAWFVLNRQDV